MSKTNIETINENIQENTVEINDDNLIDIMDDFSLSTKNQLLAIERYASLYPDNIGEYINRISGMYLFGGTIKLKDILKGISATEKIPVLYRLECVYALLSYQVMVIGEEEEDDNKITEEKNKKIKEEAYNILNQTIEKIQSLLPTPCRLDAVYRLMCSPKHQQQAMFFFNEIISNNNLECEYRYKSILSIETKSEIVEPNFFLKNSFENFMLNENNYTFYRILSGQYLLQKYKGNEQVENILLGFAQDIELDYNLRADATDTLLRLGSEINKKKSREIIMLLGGLDGSVRTMFDNAQNVHTEEIEESVIEILEKLSEQPLLKINDTSIDFKYIESQIENILNQSIEKSGKNCKHCMKNDPKKFCSDECEDQYSIHRKIRVALNRINMDRALYSKYNNTLVTILLKIWSFMLGHENEEEMKERLIEELEEMSGTCSTGFATRLVNVISGLSDFNIRISWKDQIIGNLSGRLNAMARKITESNSEYYNKNDIVEFFLRENKEIFSEVIMKITGLDLVNHKKNKTCMRGFPCKFCTAVFPSMTKILEVYLQENKEKKIKSAVEIFAENVYNEMTLDISKFNQRGNFLYFFRTSMPEIKEEMYTEFKGLISDDEFDLYFRNALMIYEGVV